MSPAFMAIGGVGVLLYGLVLAGVLASMPKRVPPPVVVRPELPATAPPFEVASTAVGPRPPAPEHATVAPKATGPTPPAEQKKKPDQPPKKPSSKPKSKKAGKGADSKAELAKASPPPPPVRTAVFKPSRTIDDLGDFIDPVGDCQLQRSGSSLAISLPGKLHILSPALETLNAPRMLTDIEGDFVAEVYIPGEMKPGMQSVNYKGVAVPVAYQGAGLLVWNDPRNFLRLERSAAVQGRQLANQVLMEAFKNDQPVGQRYIEVGREPVHLRIERRGDTIACSYSRDGKAWTEAKSFKDLFPPMVQVGISAANTAKKPLQAQFENFRLNQPTPAGPG
jgi:regulation of enolase protein 1 (concanavalin A-like superfamily)